MKPLLSILLVLLFVVISALMAFDDLQLRYVTETLSFIIILVLGVALWINRKSSRL